MPTSIKAGQVFLQEADYGLEVAVAEAAKRPTSADMRKAWKARHGGRPSPVLLAVGYPGGDGPAVAVCGPAGQDPPVHFDLDLSRVERLAATALAEPTRHAAQRCLLRLLPEVESDLPGVVNSGLLATQELLHGVPHRPDWHNATKAGRPALKKRGRSLIEALGFTVSQLGANTSLLTAGAERRAVAVFLDEGETFDAPGARYEGVSPVSHALAVAGREHLSWVVLTRASEIRLYAARPEKRPPLYGGTPHPLLPRLTASQISWGSVSRPTAALGGSWNGCGRVGLRCGGWPTGSCTARRT
jgi:hypothetical protein